jgi:tRNA-dihydrouridine synthase 1
VPVFANGNILFQEDIEECLRETGCDGVMSAEGILYNPALFVGLPPSPLASASAAPDPDAALLQRHPRHTDLAQEYLSIVTSLRTATSASAIKGHLFKILRPSLMRHMDLRERLGRVKVDQHQKGKEKMVGKPFWATGLEPYIEVVQEMAERMRQDEEKELAGDGEDGARKSTTQLVRIQEGTGLKLLPWWLAQPYWRPLPKGNQSPAKIARWIDDFA